MLYYNEHGSLITNKTVLFFCLDAHDVHFHKLISTYINLSIPVFLTLRIN